MKPIRFGRKAAIVATMGVLLGGCGAESPLERPKVVRGPVPREPVPAMVALPAETAAERPAPVFEGKADPFAPLYRSRPGGTGPGGPEVDLERFRLTALVRSPGGMVAILWEDGGQSHVVRAGADLGRNIVVADVGPDRLVLQADERDARGESIRRVRELTLPGAGD